MNYVYTPCQQKKGQFTAGQMTTMVSKFGTFPFSDLAFPLSRITCRLTLLRLLRTTEFYRYNKTTCRKASVPCLRNVHCCSLTCVNATKLCA